MAQVSRINGFRPVKTVTGAAWNGQGEVCFMDAADATVVMVGDAVQLAGNARAATGVPTVTRLQSATGATTGVFGIVVGILFSGMGDTGNVPPVTDLNTPVFRRASTDRYVLVCTDPNVIYEVQIAGAGPAAAAATALVGLNGQFTLTAGNTATGNSGMQLDSAGTATTAALPLKIVGIPNRPDNVPGDPFLSFYVKLNMTQYNGGVVGIVGV
jgi:hypothetical protein